MKKKILFVCHGNICRSPMAEFIMKKLVHDARLDHEFEIASAATSTEEIGNSVYPPARRKLAEHGISCTGKTARQMTQSDYRYYDLLVCMDQQNLRNMQRIVGGDPDGKMHLLLEYYGSSASVADPWYTGNFDATWEDCYKGCSALLSKLRGEETKPYEQEDKSLAVAIFAAGCFWGVQHYMAKQKGVVRTFAGYTGGDEPYPTYDQVRKHETHHLEAVLVEFDASAVSYEELCRLFFEIHDPAQTDGQGPDIGEQYLSGVFYTDEEQRQTANRLISQLRTKGYEVNTRVEKAGTFWIAELYHQNYYAETGGSPYCHVRRRKF